MNFYKLRAMSYLKMNKFGEAVSDFQDLAAVDRKSWSIFSEALMEAARFNGPADGKLPYWTYLRIFNFCVHCTACGRQN